MSAAGDRAPVVARYALLVAVALAIVVVLLPDPPALDPALGPNLAALAVSSLAAACGAWRAVHATGRRRRSWTALAAASGSWAVGQVVWTWLEATGREPFPSVADLFYLAFGPLACLGLLLVPTDGGHARRLQRVLDGMVVGLALALLSWHTALGATLRAVDPDRALASALSVAYPVIDVVVIVLTVLTVARTPPDTPRTPLVLLAVGLTAFSVSDSAFVFLSAVDGYQPGQAVDVGWAVGFGCLGMAALLDSGATARRDGDALLPAGGVLPYLPVMAVLGIEVWLGLTGRPASPLGRIGMLVLVALLMARQYLTLRQNVRLAARVSAREQELRHQAFHDRLTGLANRALFSDRLEHAVHLHSRDGRPVAVLFLDLDDFKSVNDSLGHAAGDQLLVRVAERVQGAVRTGDTVARLGGDEFGVLLESGDDPGQAAARIAAALRAPFPVGGGSVQVRASTGIARLTGTDVPIDADELLIRADGAMYTAKRATKAAAGN